MLIAGVDEAGRGPLAGPVIAAAVILNPKKPIEGLRDSKQLSKKKRELFYSEIIEKSLAYGVGCAEVDEIDDINILQASLLAMRRAVLQLNLAPELVLIDGNKAPELPFKTRTIIRGDQTEKTISAASIIAKVFRDREMLALHKQYPEYGFEQHKGYPTKLHLMNLQKFGVSAVHRKSFAPVRTLSPN
jgi:ribonuclease HII